MVIVLLVPGFPADEHDTTCIPFLQQFCIALVKLNPNVCPIIIAFQYPYKRKQYLWNGIQVYSAGGRGNKFNRLFTWAKVFALLIRIRKQHDIAIIHSFWMTECALMGQWFSRFFNIRHISYLIGQDALKSNKYLRYLNFPKLTIVATSDMEADTFFKNTGVKINYIIPAGVDMDIIKPLIKGIHPGYPEESPRSIDILGVGALTSLKNYLLFTEIIRELRYDYPGIKSCIIGKGEQEKMINEKIHQCGLEDNLILLGEIPHPDVFTYMRKSKILLHTSGYEGQSNVIMEALGCGLDIVCFDVGRIHTEGKIWACKDKTEMINRLKAMGKMNFLPESTAPVILHTNQDMAREFLKVYGI